MGICGVAVLSIFLCGVAVKKIPACGVAVISSLTVCDVCILKCTVFGEMKLSAVLSFPKFWTDDFPETFLYRLGSSNFSTQLCSHFH